ncbi:MAG: hypothetical protein NW224_26535 [Leptolyngbyaceae cyanobacterium bins.302]|nr:hypothetical protein [Leptolyngbyaceae cyanobacterium bins.302]
MIISDRKKLWNEQAIAPPHQASLSSNKKRSPNPAKEGAIVGLV